MAAVETRQTRRTRLNRAGVLDRYRLYHEADDLFNETSASWTPREPLPHLVADALGAPSPFQVSLRMVVPSLSW